MHCVANAEFRNVKGDGICTYYLTSKTKVTNIVDVLNIHGYRLTHSNNPAKYVS